MGKSKLVLLVLLMAILGSCSKVSEVPMLLGYSESEVMQLEGIEVFPDSLYTSEGRAYTIIKPDLEVVYFFDYINSLDICNSILVVYKKESDCNKQVKEVLSKINNNYDTECVISKEEELTIYDFPEITDFTDLTVQVGKGYVTYNLDYILQPNSAEFQEFKNQLWELLNN